MADREVPFLDLSRLHESIRAEIDAAIDRVLCASAFVGARSSRAFEEAFAEASGAEAAAGCGSGTDAISLALRALGVGPGDEVIVPSMTFVATAEPVVHVGADPVLADVDPETLLLTEATVAAVRSDRTRAVIPVHLYGHVVPFDLLESWRSDDLFVVEDAAQAHLAHWEGRPVGSVGQVATYSFYPGKNLGALGDAGLVTSADPSLVAEIVALRDHGRSDKYRHDEIGYCSRLDGLQAAVLEVKLRHLPRWTRERRDVAARYRSQIPELLVPWSDGAVHHLLVANLDPDVRKTVMECLESNQIGHGVHYPISLADQPSMARWARPTPAASEAADRVLSLPMDPMMTDGEVARVVETVETALEGR